MGEGKGEVLEWIFRGGQTKYNSRLQRRDDAFLSEL